MSSLESRKSLSTNLPSMLDNANITLFLLSSTLNNQKYSPFMLSSLLGG